MHLKAKGVAAQTILIKPDSFHIACTIKHYNGWIVCPGAAFLIQSLSFSKATTKFLCPSHWAFAFSLLNWSVLFFNTTSASDKP